MPSRNATRLHKRSIHPSRLWKPYIVQNLSMVAYRTLSFARHPIYGNQNQVAQAIGFMQ